MLSPVFFSNSEVGIAISNVRKMEKQEGKNDVV